MDQKAMYSSGKEEGIEIGQKQGIEIGQKQEKIEIAKKMLKEKMSTEQISKITKLNKEEIEALLKNETF